MYISTVLLHNGGFCNNFTKRCLHTHIGAFQNKCTIKHPCYVHKGYMKSMEFYENYITLFCLEKQTY
jgi:hypothetical protein